MALGYSTATADFKTHLNRNGIGWYWNLHAAGNHEIVATDAGYSTQANARAGANIVAQYAAGAPIQDSTRGQSGSGTRFELYVNSAGQYQWRFWHNGYNYGHSESYYRRESAEHSINVVKAQARTATIN